MTDSTIQVRIDKKTKKFVNKILKDLGLDMSSAIKAYLRQIIIKQGIPFQLITKNGLTLSQEKEITKASEEAKQGINVEGPFSTKKELENYQLEAPFAGVIRKMDFKV